METIKNDKIKNIKSNIPLPKEHPQPKSNIKNEPPALNSASLRLLNHAGGKVFKL